MTGILGDIVAYKRNFVEQCKKCIPQRELEGQAVDAPPVRSFADALSGDGCSLIAEIKTASPSRGIIRDDVTVEDVAKAYTDNGARCISVLTDEKYFKGSLGRLGKARKASTLPLLRKDFIIDPYQLYEARCAGADAVLLIAACLDDAELEDFVEISTLLSLDTLVEVHNREEMDRISSLNTKLIGINNRNLETFETDIEVTGELAPHAPKHAALVSESGIFTPDDVRKVYAMGARAFLVGEAIMKEQDMAGKIAELAGAVSLQQR